MVICFLQPFLRNPNVTQILLSPSSLSSTNQVLPYRSHALGLSLLFLLAYEFSVCNWLISVLSFLEKSCVAPSCMWYLSGGLGKPEVLEGLVFRFTALFQYLSFITLCAIPFCSVCNGSQLLGSAPEKLGNLGLPWMLLNLLPGGGKASVHTSVSWTLLLPLSITGWERGVENQKERRGHVLELCLTESEFPLELKIFELWTDLLKTVHQAVLWKLMLQHNVILGL